MDQDAAWYGGRPHFRCGPSSPPQKWGRVPSPIFSPCPLWPNGWMHQDATWYRCRPQPRRLCVRWGPSPLPPKGRSPTQFSAHVYCGQTAAWIKMPFGRPTVVGLGPDDIVLDKDPAPFPKRGGAPPPQFSAHFYCGQTAGCIKMPLGM